MREVRVSLVVVMSGFPRRSETFALNELLSLEKRGLLARVFSTKPGDGAPLQPGADRLAGRTELLPGASAGEQAQALVARVAELGVCGIHGYFAHEPAAVAELAAREIGVPFGFSTHARDARKVARAELYRRARAASRVIACNLDVAGEFENAGATVCLVPHGVDEERFAPAPMLRSDVLELVAVGRLVPKKGYDVLIDALARTRTACRLRIIGEGPERTRLEQAVASHGLGARVELTGPLTHDSLPAVYASAHALVVPSVVDAGGDRDGLPNVVLEAMASGRPVVGTAVGAIANAVVDGQTGILVPPRDPGSLAAAIDRLAQSVELTQRLGLAARQRVQREFTLGRCTSRLVEILGETYGC